MDNSIEPIWGYQAPFLEQKLLQSHVFKSSDEFHSAFAEFKKYCLLNKRGYRDLGMHSEKVDALWHQFILFTREYHDFCAQHLGAYLHHEPSLEPESEAQSGFYSAYVAEFGTLNSLWLDDSNCTAQMSNCTAKQNCTAKFNSKANCTAKLSSRNCTARVAR